MKLEPREAARLDIAIRSLPQIERRILLMSRIQGLSHAEIGSRVGMSEEEVRQLLVRVLLGLARQADRPA